MPKKNVLESLLWSKGCFYQSWYEWRGGSTLLGCLESAQQLHSERIGLEKEQGRLEALFLNSLTLGSTKPLPPPPATWEPSSGPERDIAILCTDRWQQVAYPKTMALPTEVLLQLNTLGKASILMLSFLPILA